MLTTEQRLRIFDFTDEIIKTTKKLLEFAAEVGTGTEGDKLLKVIEKLNEAATLINKSHR